MCSKWAAQGAVARRDRPAVLGEPDLGPPHRDHRLDRDRHPLRESRPAAGVAEVRDVRVLVVVAADAVAHEALDDREAGALHDDLHGVGDVADPVAEPRLGDPCGERVLAHVEEPLRLGVDRSDGERVRAVRDRAVEGHADVDRHEAAVLDARVVGDTVDDDVVDGDADRARVALVALGRGHAAAGTDELVGDPVELEGRDPWLDPSRPTCAIVSATSAPARPMRSISAGPLRMITLCPPQIPDLQERIRNRNDP